MRWLVALGIIIAAALFCLVMIFTGMANAHSWYSKRSDPVWNNSCCGGTDCHELDGRFVTAETEGLRVRLTAEQARAINPKRNLAVDAVVEWNRIQISEDGNYHICLMTYFNVMDRRHGVWCMFAPPNT